jgi:hypothetical protein
LSIAHVGRRSRTPHQTAAEWLGTDGALTDEEKAAVVPAVEQPHAGPNARLVINSQMLDQPVRWSDVV